MPPTRRPRRSGWTSSPEPPVEKRPRIRRAQANTGRASSGRRRRKPQDSAPSPSPSSLPSPVYRAHITWIHFTLALLKKEKKKKKLSRSLFKKDHWILPTPLQSVWPHGYSPSQPLPSVSVEHRRCCRHADTTVPRIFYSSVLQSSRRGTEPFICNIAKEISVWIFFFLKMKLLVHYKAVLWSIKFYVPVSPHSCERTCACALSVQVPFRCFIKYWMFVFSPLQQGDTVAV